MHILRTSPLIPFFILSFNFIIIKLWPPCWALVGTGIQALIIKVGMGKAQGSVSRRGSPRTKLRGQEAFLGGVDLKQQVTMAEQTTAGDTR